MTLRPELKQLVEDESKNLLENESLVLWYRNNSWNLFLRTIGLGQTDYAHLTDLTSDEANELSKTFEIVDLFQRGADWW